MAHLGYQRLFHYFVDPLLLRGHLVFPASCFCAEDDPIHLPEKDVMIFRAQILQDRFHADKGVAEGRQTIKAAHFGLPGNTRPIPHIFQGRNAVLGVPLRVFR